MAYNSVVSVAMGGRWRELEEEIRGLTSELAASRAEGRGSDRALAEVLEVYGRAEDAEAAATRWGREEAAEVARLRGTLGMTQRDLAGATERAASSEEQGERLREERDELASECAGLRKGLEAALADVARLRGAQEHLEASVAQERGGRSSAECRGEEMQAEIAALEARLSNRGTHVDLLLRDKERLWAQLSRLQRSQPQRDHQRRAEASSAAQPQLQQRGGRAAAKAGAVACPAPSRAERARGRQRASCGESPAGPQAVAQGSVVVADLERKLWHAQRALERERTSHDATRAALVREGFPDEAPS